MEQSSILLVDDDEVLRGRLAELIATDPTLTIAAAVANQAGGRAALHDPAIDLALIDLGLPDGDGADLIEIAAERGIIPLVLTTFGDEGDVFKALSRGARGYLVKDAPGFEICDALHQAIGGSVPVSPSIAGYLLERSLQIPRVAPSSRAQGDDTLTEMEGRVLELLACGYTYQECAERLSVSQHTISSHVRNIYRKLGAHSCTSAVYRAVASGSMTWGRHGPSFGN